MKQRKPPTQIKTCDSGRTRSPYLGQSNEHDRYALEMMKDIEAKRIHKMKSFRVDKRTIIFAEPKRGRQLLNDLSDKTDK